MFIQLMPSLGKPPITPDELCSGARINVRE